MSESMNPANEHQAFKKARKQASLAGCFKFNQQQEDDLAAIERNPALAFTLSGDHRSILGYYKSARDAAIAEGIDVTNGGSR